MDCQPPKSTAHSDLGWLGRLLVANGQLQLPIRTFSVSVGVSSQQTGSVCPLGFTHFLVEEQDNLGLEEGMYLFFSPQSLSFVLVAYKHKTFLKRGL